MATAGPTPAIAPPRRRLLLALLVVSALLNLFFVAGAAWTRVHGPARPLNREERYQQMARQLDLAPEQRAGFDHYVAAMRARDDKMRQQIAPLVADAWDAIAKPQADVGQIMQRFDEASVKWREFQREATVETLDFLSILSPEQRDKFIAIVRERRAPWLRRHAR
jgi:Spy/CpxP family protein refolding chaperone